MVKFLYFIVTYIFLGASAENTTCGENEVMNNCPSVRCEYCPTCDEEARACLSEYHEKCLPAKCTCRNNYRRLQNGTCIPTRECPAFKCPRANEQFDTCPLCPTDNCTRATSDGTCHFFGRIGIPLQCRPSCRCKKNYWRDGNRCVPYEKCPNVKDAANCTRPNESLQCIRSCPPLRTCENRNKTYHCLVNTTAPCTYQCTCDKGFYRNADGFCVTSDLCDKKCNDPNADYKPDKKKCPSDLCSSIVSRFACDPKEQGQPGCVCKSGFLRLNESTTCIPANQCPELANSPDNKPPNTCTGPNESIKCVKYCPRPRTCIGRFLRYKCFNTSEVCKDECVCDEGFYRNPDGFCVTSDLCDKKCTGPNEEYKADKKSCPPEICRSIVSRYACDPADNGQPGCACKSGFLRLNLNSTCMPIEECPELKNSPDYNKPKCTLPNESLKCVKACPPPRTCKNRGVFISCLQNKSEFCKDKCICDDGFYRNEDGFCVTNDLCDKKCPGPNEVYKPDRKNCPPQTCQSIFALYKCDPEEKGQPGCVCKPGFLRVNASSTCIPSEKCRESTNSTDTSPLKCSLPNESLQCVRSCPPASTCDNRNKIYHCLVNASAPCTQQCVCNKGYYRNSDGFCVTSEQCGKKCTKPNESLKCVKSCPRPRTCFSRYIRYKCPDVSSEVCKDECVCNDGFYRNPDGFCVTSNLCDKKCTGPNEEYKERKKSCPPEICKSLDAQYKCDSREEGQPGCVCKEGFLRKDLNSTCIPVADCPEFGDFPDYDPDISCSQPDVVPDTERYPIELQIQYWRFVEVEPKDEEDIEDA